MSDERIVTFVVRLVESSAGVHAVVERVKTGRKQRVETVDGIGRVIAAMAVGDTGKADSPETMHSLRE